MAVVKDSDVRDLSQLLLAYTEEQERLLIGLRRLCAREPRRFAASAARLEVAVPMFRSGRHYNYFADLDQRIEIARRAQR